MWVDYWEGGPKGMLAPPLKLLGGPGPPWPPLFLRLCSINHLFLKTLHTFCQHNEDVHAEL